MKHSTRIALLATIFLFKQTDCSQNLTLAQSPIDFNLEANRRIEEAYITPAMQWAILSFYRYPFVIDTITKMPVLYHISGQPITNPITKKPEIMPSIEAIVNEAVTISSPSPKAIQALETARDAIDIATYVTALEAAYNTNQENYDTYQATNRQISNQLKAKADLVEQAIDKITSLNTQTQNTMFDYQKKPLENKNHIMLDSNDRYRYIDLNNFTTIKDPRKAAQLLFQQCFIAQQHHLKNNIQINQLDINNVHSLFDEFPTMDELIKIAKSKPNPADKNKMLKQIRQAVQTALFIANQHTEYYFNSFVNRDPLTVALKSMDDKIKELCLDLQYGATADDINKEAMWSNLTNIAMGLGVAAATGAAIWAYNNPNETQNFLEATKSTINKTILATSPNNEQQKSRGQTGLEYYIQGIEKEHKANKIEQASTWSQTVWDTASQAIKNLTQSQGPTQLEQFEKAMDNFSTEPTSID